MGTSVSKDSGDQTVKYAVDAGVHGGDDQGVLCMKMCG